MPRPDKTPSKSHLSLYYGRECIGHIVDESGEWKAFDTNGKKLGTYVSMKAAADATSNRYRKRRGGGSGV
jgi:hypothetical protein